MVCRSSSILLAEISAPLGWDSALFSAPASRLWMLCFGALCKYPMYRRLPTGKEEDASVFRKLDQAGGG